MPKLVQITIRATGYNLRLRRSLCGKAEPFRKARGEAPLQPPLIWTALGLALPAGKRPAARGRQAVPLHCLPLSMDWVHPIWVDYYALPCILMHVRTTVVLDECLLERAS